ncbi:ATP-dependent RNA helicase dbp6 [Coemansia sp. RSA 552]|nr:ATP-dependent RNA helicase dbp6 [Coemansia sp. RSA 552]
MAHSKQEKRGSDGGDKAQDRPARRSRHEEIIEKKDRHLKKQKRAKERAEAEAEATAEPAPEPESDEIRRVDDAAAAHGLEHFPDFSQELGISQAQALEAGRMGIPHWLAHPTTIDRDASADISEARFALSPHILARCEKAGISSLFAVQAAVIPVLRAANTLSRLRQHVRDVCVSSHTGSGKTLAFVIPIVERLRTRLAVRLRALVVLPTKDLARQVKESFAFFCAGTDLRVGLATGDTSLAREQLALVDPGPALAGGSSKVDILVCTPGRLLDHIALTPNFTLQHLEFWVMDEADRLLGDAFQEWLPKVQSSIEAASGSASSGASVGRVPGPDACTQRRLGMDAGLLDRPAPRIQKLLFSATLTQNPAKISRLKLVRPLYISVANTAASDGEGAFVFPSALKELYAVCPADEKPLWLIYILWERQISGGVCFTKSLETAHRLAQVVQAWVAEVPDSAWPGKKPVVAEYSSDLPAADRTRVMRLFRQGQIGLLICSDLIARGLDVDQISAVINYDVPTHMGQYTHRVGRTARAGRQGTAYTLVGAPQMFHFKAMMKENKHWTGCLTSLNARKSTLAELRQQYDAALEKVGTIYG